MAKRAAEREGALYPISFRASAEMRARLERAASQSGRSLTAEIERRLELSLAEKDYLRRLWGDDVFRLAEAMHRSLSYIEHVEGKRWIEDEETFELFRATVPEIVRNYYDLVHENPRAVPHGSFEGKSREEMAQIYAALSVTPPRPKRVSPPPSPQLDVEPRLSLAERMRQMLAEDPDLASGSSDTKAVSDEIPEER